MAGDGARPSGGAVGTPPPPPENEPPKNGAGARTGPVLKNWTKGSSCVLNDEQHWLLKSLPERKQKVFVAEVTASGRDSGPEAAPSFDFEYEGRRFEFRLYNAFPKPEKRLDKAKDELLLKHANERLPEYEEELNPENPFWGPGEYEYESARRSSPGNYASGSKGSSSHQSSPLRPGTEDQKFQDQKVRSIFEHHLPSFPTILNKELPKTQSDREATGKALKNYLGDLKIFFEKVVSEGSRYKPQDVAYAVQNSLRTANRPLHTELGLDGVDKPLGELLASIQNYYLQMPLNGTLAQFRKNESFGVEAPIPLRRFFARWEREKRDALAHEIEFSGHSEFLKILACLEDSLSEDQFAKLMRTIQQEEKVPSPRVQTEFFGLDANRKLAFSEETFPNAEIFLYKQGTPAWLRKRMNLRFLQHTAEAQLGREFELRVPKNSIFWGTTPPPKNNREDEKKKKEKEKKDRERKEKFEKEKKEKEKEKKKKGQEKDQQKAAARKASMANTDCRDGVLCRNPKCSFRHHPDRVVRQNKVFWMSTEMPGVGRFESQIPPLVGHNGCYPAPPLQAGLPPLGSPMPSANFFTSATEAPNPLAGLPPPLAQTVNNMGRNNPGQYWTGFATVGAPKKSVSGWRGVFPFFIFFALLTLLGEFVGRVKGVSAMKNVSRPKNVADTFMVADTFLGLVPPTGCTHARVLFDAGALKSCIGRDWWARMPNAGAFRFFNTEPVNFRFGVGEAQSTCAIDVPISPGIVVRFQVVDVEVPPLVGRDHTRKNVANVLESACAIHYTLQDVFLPFTTDSDNDSSHIWVEVGTASLSAHEAQRHSASRFAKHINACAAANGRPVPAHQFFSDSCPCFFEFPLETGLLLKKCRALHIAFLHPSLQRMRTFLGKSWTKEVAAAFRKIEDECEFCKDHVVSAPRVPAVRFPPSASFNEIISLDVLYCNLIGKMVLHVCCAFSRFSAAVVIRSRKTEAILQAFHACWLKFFGLPTKEAWVDGEGALGSGVAEDVFSSFGLLVVVVEKNAHHRLPVERQHSFLQRLVEETAVRVMRAEGKRDYSDADAQILLDAALFVKNTTLFYGGFSPCQWAFPSLLTRRTPSTGEGLAPEAD